MPLGVADRRIANPLITASSYHSFYCGPWNARLHQRRVSRLGGSWCARRNDLRQWLQVQRIVENELNHLFVYFLLRLREIRDLMYLYFSQHVTHGLRIIVVLRLFLSRKSQNSV